MRIEVLSDASLCHMTGACGFGHLITVGEREQIGWSFSREPVRNATIGEMKAVLEALAVIGDLGIFEGCTVADQFVIRTDSTAAISGLLNQRKLKTPEELQAAAAFRQIVDAQPMATKLEHLKARSGNTRHDRVDRMAKIGLGHARAHFAKLSGQCAIPLDPDLVSKWVFAENGVNANYARKLIEEIQSLRNQIAGGNSTNVALWDFERKFRLAMENVEVHLHELLQHNQ